MYLVRVVLIILIAALLDGASARAATQDWDDWATPQFNHLDADDGLPHPVSLAIVQDRAGFVWIATPGGLARWDGYRMRVFHHDEADPTSLPEDNVARLLPDPKGGLWLASVTGIVAHYDPTTERFRRYPDMSSGRIRVMVDDGAGGLWLVGTARTGHFQPDTNIWRPLTIAAPPGAKMPDPVTSLYRDHDGGLWIGTGHAVFHKAVDADRPTPVDADNGQAVAVSSWFQDRKGRLWFGTTAGQIGFVDPAGKLHLTALLAASGDYVSTITQPEPDCLWVSLYGGGLRRLGLTDGTTRIYRHTTTEPDSLGDDFINDTFVSRSGLLLLSTLRGVDVLNPNNHQFAAITRLGGLAGQDVRSMAAAPDGRVWLGFRDEGVQLFDPKMGRIETLSIDSSKPETAQAFDLVQAMVRTYDGSLWTGSIHGLFRIDPVKRSVTRFDKLGTVNVISLLAEGTTLWAGGTMGLVRIDGDTVETYRHDPSIPASLSDNSVSALLRDNEGRLWVGTQRGLNLFDEAKHTFRRFVFDPDRSDSLPNNVVTNLMEDRSGRLWVATLGGIGVLVFDGQGKPHFRRVQRAGGMPNDGVTAVLQDHDGTIWASTFDGLAAIDPTTFAVKAYHHGEGVGIATHWANSALQLGDGTLLFGGFGGMSVVHPDRAQRWSYRPSVQIIDLRLGNQRLPPGPVTMEPGQGPLSVEFAALDFSAPELNRYAYQLDGLDSGWTSVDAYHRIATFSNLPPGRYDLLIRGSNREGMWTDPPLDLPIVVKPAWYQTFWFRALAALVALTSVALLILARTAYLQARQRALERLVAEQTRELAAAHARAVAGEEAARRAQEAAEAANEAKSRLLAVVSHEIRTPLNGVLALVDVLDPHGLDREQKRHLEVATRAGETLHRLVDSILDYERLGAADGVLQRESIELDSLAEEAVALLRPEAEAKGLMLGLSIAVDVPRDIAGDRSALYRLLLNLLGNAIKFTPAGSIMVTLAVGSDETANRFLEIAVADTGIGIAPEMQEAIFDAFVQADNSIRRQYGGTGLGLAICRRIAELMNGQLSVESNPGGGSVFRLSLPVDEPASQDVAPVERSLDRVLGVLVVDDDEINRFVAASLLARLGHRVTLAASGEAALAEAEAQDFDVVLTDLHMPVMDGFDLAQRLRALPRQAGHPSRILAMTADLTQESRARCAAHGLEAMVAKPLQREAVRAALVTEAELPLDKAAAQGSSDWLDHDFLMQQWEILGTVELFRLARIFQRSSRTVLAGIEAAAGAQDWSQVAALAHRLASGAGALALDRLVKSALGLEAASAARTLGDAELAELVLQLGLLRRGSIDALLLAMRPLRGWRGDAGATDPLDQDSMATPSL